MQRPSLVITAKKKPQRPVEIISLDFRSRSVSAGAGEPRQARGAPALAGLPQEGDRRAEQGAEEGPARLPGPTESVVMDAPAL